MARLAPFALILSLVAAGCGSDPIPVEPPAPDCDAGFLGSLPQTFPRPSVPADNPMTEAKIELGRHLFYDKRLSENRTQACASCHKQSVAFTDGRTVGLGSTGEDHPRNALSLTNVAYRATLGWSNPLVSEMEEQAVVPMFGDDPVELGMHGMEDVLLARLREEPRYAALFPVAFPEEAEPLSVTSIVRAISSFERTLISGDSPYDRFARGDFAALSEEAKRGMRLFDSDQLACSRCHSGFNFQDSVDYACKDSADVRFHNNGLYNIGGTGAFPPDNTGLFAVSGLPSDMGSFRTPTLRNIAITAPYMHDGSIETLDEVLDHYAAGGRTISSGPYAGDGSRSPFKSELVAGFALSAQERGDLIAFLESLTDETFLTDPALSNPWLEP